MDPMQNFELHRRSSSFETFVYFGLILGAYISKVAEIFFIRGFYNFLGSLPGNLE